jgi:hypothetical protein
VAFCKRLTVHEFEKSAFIFLFYRLRLSIQRHDEKGVTAVRLGPFRTADKA